MGPNTNPQLYHETAAHLVATTDEEFLRRNLVAPTLAELSVLFNDKDNTSHPVIEPTLFARLYALSMVQRSRMGINGFDPMDAFDYGGRVEARAAPPHDEFMTDTNATVRTRVIYLTMNDRKAQDIDIFGINMYQPNPGEDAPDKQPTIHQNPSGFVVVNKRGTVTKRQKQISGETVIFGVRNTVTQDAKLYTVTIERPDATQSGSGGLNIEYSDENTATVSLPDNRHVTVRQLHGELQRLAVDELQAGAGVLNGTTSLNQILTAEEQSAARSVVAGSDYV